MTQHIAYFSARQHGISISVSRCSCLCWSYSSGFDLWVRGRVVLQSSDESACARERTSAFSLQLRGVVDVFRAVYVWWSFCALASV